MPSEDEDLIMNARHFCDDHMEKCGQEGLPIVVAMRTTLGTLLAEEEFFKIAFRVKNGYGMPEDMDMDSVPEGERPDIQHINDTIREVEPLCCYLDEITDKQYLSVLAEKIKEDQQAE